jgi:hypothetical protein
MNTTPRERSPDVRIGLGLWVVFSALYFLTYSGVQVSTDERILFDGAHSLAHYGNLWLGYSNTLRPAATYPGLNPVPTLDSEPGQALIAVPLVWLADALPRIGVMQTVWVLNVLVSGGIISLFYFYSGLYGFEQRIRLTGSVLLGTATILWAYSKTFFREPLFTLLALLAAYWLERARRSPGRSGVGWGVVGIIAVASVFNTKEAGIFLLPVLLVILIPESLRMTRQTVGILAGVIGVALLISVVLGSVTGGRFDVWGRLFNAINQAENAPYALAGYLLSPGRSIWAFSPILLLTFPGMLKLARLKQWRLVGIGVAALISFAGGYAVFQHVNWYGGLGWGARYMLPILPFLMLLTLPVLAHRGGLLRGLVIIALCIVSIALQIISVSVPVNAYYTELATRGGVGWIEGTWDLARIPQVIAPGLIGKVASDLAWNVNSAPLIILLCLIIIGLGMEVISGRVKGVIGVIGTVILLGCGLWVAADDPRYGANDANAKMALSSVNSALTKPYAVLLGSEAYLPHFMNFYKNRAPIFLLPRSPGEVDIPGHPPERITPLPADRVAPVLTLMLPRLGQMTPHWLYVTEFHPDTPGRFRATEHYLTRHFYPVREVLTQPTVRVIEFYAGETGRGAPSEYQPLPEACTLRFANGSLTLSASDIPDRVKRGEVLPISLRWRAGEWASGIEPFDYQVNLTLIGENGVIGQRSGYPAGSFGRVTEWIKWGGVYSDHHGLLIPPNALPGRYELWGLMYDWRTGARLGIEGATKDYVVLKTIQVE